VVSAQQVLLAMIALIRQIMINYTTLVLYKMMTMKMITFAKQNHSHLAEVKRNPRVCLCKAKSKVGSFRWTVLDWQYWVGGPSLVERRGHFFDK
jgi:hypothetical protein